MITKITVRASEAEVERLRELLQSGGIMVEVEKIETFVIKVIDSNHEVNSYLRYDNFIPEDTTLYRKVV
jgi:hypothetical protein